MTSYDRHTEQRLRRHRAAPARTRYVTVPPDGFDRERAIFHAVVLDFIQETQPGVGKARSVTRPEHRRADPH